MNFFATNKYIKIRIPLLIDGPKSFYYFSFFNVLWYSYKTLKILKYFIMYNMVCMFPKIISIITWRCDCSVEEFFVYVLCFI